MVTGDLEGADGLTFTRNVFKGLTGGSFSKEQSTSQSPTSLSLFTVAAAPGPLEATL